MLLLPRIRAFSMQTLSVCSLPRSCQQKALILCFGDKGQEIAECRLAGGMVGSFTQQLPPSACCVLPLESVASCRRGSACLHDLSFETE